MSSHIPVGALVDSLGTHGLSCHMIQGRFSRHTSLNTVINRTLDSAKIFLLAWNFTIRWETSRWSHSHSVEKWTYVSVGMWHTQTPLLHHMCLWLLREALLMRLIPEEAQVLWPQWGVPYHTNSHWDSGVFGSGALAFLKELGTMASGEQRSYHFLLQRISVELQSGNSASIYLTRSPIGFMCFIIAYFIILIDFITTLKPVKLNCTVLCADNV